MASRQSGDVVSLVHYPAHKIERPVSVSGAGDWYVYIIRHIILYVREFFFSLYLQSIIYRLNLFSYRENKQKVCAFCSPVIKDFCPKVACTLLETVTIVACTFEK